ncbi:glycosyl transferase [bacterium SM23_31]|nr:MAG: glycosyl transferase [bacterium SM23_31]
MNDTYTISGFTFVRNALKFDYPIIEAITSILPVCDEFIVNVGKSEDETLDLIKTINSDKIKIVESVWDETLRTGGHILALQTDIALSHCTGDWCFYIQADEVVHEKYHPVISASVQKYHPDKRIEGLLFKYLHFYGSYNYVGASRRWYRHEIRIIRNHCGISSYMDAQGFRLNNRKLNVKPIDAYVYHYGWVKHPKIQQKKQRFFNKLWHPDSWIKNHVGDADDYDYHAIDAVQPFTGDHPAVMKHRVESQDWHVEYDPSANRLNTPLKHRILNKIENLTGYRIGEYKNFKII